MRLYLGSGLWKKEGWLNHGTTKSVWYNNLVMVYKLSTNIGTIKANVKKIKPSDIGSPGHCGSKKYNLSENFRYDIDHDLFSNKPLPIKDNSLKMVYTSHTIEHLTDENNKFLFKDVHRILANDGVFRITCPDIDYIYDKIYIKNERIDYAKSYNKNIDSGYQDFIDILCNYFSGTPIYNSDLVDSNVNNELKNIKKIDENEFKKLISKYGKFGTFEYIRKKCLEYHEKYKYDLTGFHINWFNKYKVIRFLLDAGFEKIFIRSQNESINKEFESDCFDTTWPDISLFIEAIK